MTCDVVEALTRTRLTLVLGTSGPAEGHRGAMRMGSDIPMGRFTLAAAIVAASSVALATPHCARAPGGFDQAPGQPAGTAPDASVADAAAASFFGDADAACASLPPVPTGSQCTCAWTDCKADELLCHCAPDCYEQSPDCLITVGDS